MRIDYKFIPLPKGNFELHQKLPRAALPFEELSIDIYGGRNMPHGVYPLSSISIVVIFYHRGIFVAQRILSPNDEFSGGAGWSKAEAHAVRWNDLLAILF